MAAAIGARDVVRHPHEAERSLAQALALAFPDRVSRRRDSSGESWQSVGGRGFRLDPASSLAGSQWLAVGEVAGHASGARILSAAAIEEQSRARSLRRPDRNSPRRRLRSRDGLRHADPQPAPRRDPARVRARSQARPGGDRAALLEGVREHGLGLLPWDERASQLRAPRRLRAPLRRINSAARRRSAARARRRVAGAACSPASAVWATSRRPRLRPRSKALLGYEAVRRLDRIAPAEFVSPAGSRHAIDYSAPGRPDGRSPRPGAVRPGAASDGRRRRGAAGPRDHLTRRRPIQTTKDLPGFWAGSWRDVAKDMRGPLSQASVAGRPSVGGADAEVEACDPRTLFTGTIRWA